MSTVEFFESCFRCARDAYYRVLNQPTLSRGYQTHYKKILRDLDTAIQYQEIPSEIGIELKKKFKELDYEAYKERIKKGGM